MTATLSAHLLPVADLFAASRLAKLLIMLVMIAYVGVVSLARACLSCVCVRVDSVANWRVLGLLSATIILQTRAKCIQI